MGNGLVLTLFANMSLSHTWIHVTINLFYSILRVDCGDPATPINGQQKFTITFEGNTLKIKKAILSHSG